MATWLLHTLIFLIGGIVSVGAFLLIICYLADKLDMYREDK